MGEKDEKENEAKKERKKLQTDGREESNLREGTHNSFHLVKRQM